MPVTAQQVMNADINLRKKWADLCAAAVPKCFSAERKNMEGARDVLQASSDRNNPEYQKYRQATGDAGTAGWLAQMVSHAETKVGGGAPSTGGGASGGRVASAPSSPVSPTTAPPRAPVAPTVEQIFQTAIWENPSKRRDHPYEWLSQQMSRAPLEFRSNYREALKQINKLGY